MFKNVRTLLLASAALCFAAAGAQELAPDENAKGKWGFVNESGTAVIDYKYDEAYGFVNDLAKVRKGNNYGLIDRTGREVIPCKYQAIDPAGNNIYRVAVGKIKDGVLMDDKWGYVDANNRVLVKPEYEKIGEFGENGLALLQKGDKYGFMNRKYEVIIPCKYNAVGKWNSEGRIWVCEGAKYEKGSSKKFLTGKMGIIDTDGLFIIPPKYCSIGVFDYRPYTDEEKENAHAMDKAVTALAAGHARLNKFNIKHENFGETPLCGKYGYFVSSKSAYGYKNGVVDSQGNVLVKDGKYPVVCYPQDNLAIVSQGDKINYLDLNTNKLVFKKGKTNVFEYRNGYAVVQNSINDWKLIDKDFNEVTGSYDLIRPLNDGVYVIMKDKKFGLLGHDAKEVIAPQWAFISLMQSGLMLARKNSNDKWGYLNSTGNFAIQPTYTEAKSFECGMAKVKTENGWGVINPYGREIIPCKWYSIGDITAENQNHVWVSDPADKKMCCFSIKDSRLAFNDSYSGVRNFDQDIEGHAIVSGEKTGTIGLIDKEGNIIIPLELADVKMAIGAYDYMQAKGIKNWRPIDTYRIRLRFNEKLNSHKLTDRISTDLWDY